MNNMFFGEITSTFSPSPPEVRRGATSGLQRTCLIVFIGKSSNKWTIFHSPQLFFQWPEDHPTWKVLTLVIVSPKMSLSIVIPFIGVIILQVNGFPPSCTLEIGVYGWENHRNMVRSGQRKRNCIGLRALLRFSPHHLDFHLDIMMYRCIMR